MGGRGDDVSANEQTLILHWNGVAWQRVPSPNPDGVAALAAVAASPDGPVWAVGTDIAGNKPMTLRSTGGAWKQVRCPNPPGGGGLAAVAAVSARLAWAVGSTLQGGHTLIMRWNGTRWTRVSSASRRPNSTLYGVASGSGEDRIGRRLRRYARS